MIARHSTSETVLASLPWAGAPRAEEVGSHTIKACIRCGVRRQVGRSRSGSVLCRDCRSYVRRKRELHIWLA